MVIHSLRMLRRQRQAMRPSLTTWIKIKPQVSNPLTDTLYVKITTKLYFDKNLPFQIIFKKGLFDFICSKTCSKGSNNRDHIVLKYFLTSPELKTLFKYSKNDSSFTSLSVNKNVTPLPYCPASRYKYLRSSIRLVAL